MSGSCCACVANFGMLFQGAALFDSMTVAENVAFALRREKLPEDAIKERVARALDVVELSGTEDKRPSNFPAACANASASRAPSFMNADCPL